MKTRTIVLTVVGLGMATALFASGFDKERCEYRGHHQKHEIRCDSMMDKNRDSRMIFGKMLRELDLSRSQKKEVKALMQSQRKEFKSIRKQKGKQDQRFGNGSDMSRFMTTEHFDKEAFKRISKENIELMRKQREVNQEIRLDKRADMMEKIFAILTPGQRGKLIQLSKNL